MLSPDERREMLRQLPAIGKLMQQPRVQSWLQDHPEIVVTAALRDAVQTQREQLSADSHHDRGNGCSVIEAVLDAAGQIIDAGSRPSLRRVINATGIVLHTGLGRAPLADVALQAVMDEVGRYSNLELELEDGKRGHRSGHVEPLLCQLTGAEAATVVNNNAAATLLILNTVAGSPDLGRRRRRYKPPEVIVSRGQLIEIGGSYRLPDIMKAGGVTLVEIGTTNRTRLADYAAAITDNTAGLMRVHTSNYRVTGFTEEVTTAELVGLGHEHGLTVIDDLGSGALIELQGPGLAHEPLVGDSVRAGADVICFSGDKLVGGPQAGIIVGSATLVGAVEKNPLMRTYRTDKMTLTALEATLRLYLDAPRARRELPTLAMLSATHDALDIRAGALLKAIEARCGNAAGALTATVVDSVSYAGGGSLPAQEMPTRAVRVSVEGLAVRKLAAQLRDGRPAVVARVHKDAVLFDVRTLRDDELDAVAAAVSAVAD